MDIGWSGAGSEVRLTRIRSTRAVPLNGSGVMKKTSKWSTKRKPESGLPYLLTGGVIFCATLAAVMFGRVESSVPAYIALGAGAALGTWLFRFGSRHAWISLLCLFGSLVVFIVLAANSAAFGSAGIAWIGSFVAGTNAGAACRIRAKRSAGRGCTGRVESER